MGIISSTIRIYDDAAKTTLVKTVTTSGGSTSIPVNQLSEGTEYWATAQVTDDNNLTSAESSPYRFYTLPDVVWHSGSPALAGDTISYQNDVVTDTVGTTQVGIVYGTDPNWVVYSKFYVPGRADGDLHGLAENTTYYVAPYCIDEFNREWINFDLAEDLTTPYAVPTLAWTGLATISATTWSQQINITSTAAVSSVVLHWQPVGGSENTMNLTAQTGTQNCSLTGLTPSTNYRIWVTAVNSAGTGTSATLTPTTDSPAVSVAINVNAMDNTTNQVEMRSTVTKDNTVTLTTHQMMAFSNDQHSGQAVETHTQSPATTSFSNTFGHLDPDDTYYMFSYIEYTISGDNTTYSIWSAPVRVTTYSLMSFGNITTSNTTASIPYSVNGSATSISVDYSSDNGTTWTSIPVSSLSGGTLHLSGLSVGTTYMLRGRVQNGTGWSGYTNDSFTTTSVASSVTVDSVTNVEPTTATVNISVS